MRRASGIAPLTLIILIFCPVLTLAQTPESWVEPVRDTVLDVTVEGHAPPPVFTGMARLTFPPGAHIIGGTTAGARLFLIESGSFEIEADDPVSIYRGGDGTSAEIIAAGEGGTVAAGDLAVVEGNPPFRVTNADESPSSLIDIVIWPPISEQIRPFVTEYGVVFEPLVVGDIAVFPDSPVRVLLQQYDLPQSARSSYEPAGGPILLYVDSGTLGIHSTGGEATYSSSAANAPGSVTGRVRQLEPGKDAVLTAGGAAVLHSESTGYLRNLGRTPLEIVELSFVPV